MGSGQALNFGLGNLDKFAWIDGFSSAPIHYLNLKRANKNIRFGAINKSTSRQILQFLIK